MKNLDFRYDMQAIINIAWNENWNSHPVLPYYKS